MDRPNGKKRITIIGTGLIGGSLGMALKAARLPGLERDLADERSAHEAAVADLSDARAARDAAVADLVRERQAAGDREPGYAHLQSQLEAERATVAELRQAAARAEELRDTLARETSRGQEAGEDVAVLQVQVAGIGTFDEARRQ